MTQLRTGYVRLNEYMKKSNLGQSNKCQCGEVESVKHYILDCRQYKNEREQMRRKLFEACDITDLDLNILLDAKRDDDYKHWRSFILLELENYMAETKRNATRQSC